ncbi:MAG: nicotinate-nucleotide adenylyltransferase [Eubacteriales bacterium]|nr:nicotinate-nucleotide adenylyltransferase [Eubacteriales bacterium]
MDRKKIGIMGGTFDPIHVGHLILGESAYYQFGLDAVMFMPSGNPPHKPCREGRASLEERIEMVELAIQDNPHFMLSLEEAREGGYTYTKETLERLTAANPDTDYYFIMGADSLFEFEDWREPEEIVKRCVIVAAVRDQVSMLELDAQIAHLKRTLNADIRKLSTPNIDISSRMIRNWIRRDEPIRYYLPNSVISYIHDLGLYLKSED